MCVESLVWLGIVGVLFARNLTCDHAAMFIVRVTKTASRTDKLLTVLSHMFTHTYAPYWHGAEPTLARCMQCRALLRCSDSFARLDSVDYKYVKSHSRVARRGQVVRPPLLAPSRRVTVSGFLPVAVTVTGSH